MALTGRVVVITGATGNLGPAVARAFGDIGANLALVARNDAALAEVASGLGLPPERVLAITGDLGGADSAEAIAGAVVRRFGRVDALLHLVGGFVSGAPVAELNSADFQTMLDLNLLTTFNAARAFLPHLIANGWGRLVTISSPYAQQPPARTAAYAAAKAGMEALILAIAQEVKGKGVTANVVVVRTIDTPAARLQAPKPNTAGWTTPDEIAAALLYLCSDQAGAINGARIPLYGRG